MTDLFNAWVRVLTQPGEESFNAEKGKEDLGRAVLGMFVAGLVGSVVSALWLVLWLVSGVALGIPDLSGLAGAAGQPAAALPANLTIIVGITQIILSPILAVLGFLLVTAIAHGIARAFNGRGSYTRLAYFAMLVDAPISILTSLLGWIPCLGGLIGLALSVYALVLLVVAVKTAHELTTGAAVGVVVLTIVVMLVLACCLGAIVAAPLSLAAPGIGGPGPLPK